MVVRSAMYILYVIHSSGVTKENFSMQSLVKVWIGLRCLDYEKKVIVNNSTNINKMNNHLLAY